MIMQTKRMYSHFFDWFGSNTLTVGVWAPVTRFLPQQTVNLKVIINNQSGVEISQFRIALIQVSIYFAFQSYFCFKKNSEQFLFFQL